MTPAKWSQPSSVRNWVTSAAQSWSRPAGLKSRSTRSGAQAVFGFPVRHFLRECAPTRTPASAERRACGLCGARGGRARRGRGVRRRCGGNGCEPRRRSPPTPDHVPHVRTDRGGARRSSRNGKRPEPNTAASPRRCRDARRRTGSGSPGRLLGEIRGCFAEDLAFDLQVGDLLA